MGLLEAQTQIAAPAGSLEPWGSRVWVAACGESHQAQWGWHNEVRCCWY